MNDRVLPGQEHSNTMLDECRWHRFSEQALLRHEAIDPEVLCPRFPYEPVTLRDHTHLSSQRPPQVAETASLVGLRHSARRTSLGGLQLPLAAGILK